MFWFNKHLKDKIYFKSNEDSFVKLIYEDEDFKAEFNGKSFSLKDSTLSSGKVSSKFYFNESNDSIFHPEMRFLYNYNDNQISLNRLNNTYLSDRPILNSFHGLNIYADFFKINLDQEKIFFSSTCLNSKKIASSGNKSGCKFPHSIIVIQLFEQM